MVDRNKYSKDTTSYSDNYTNSRGLLNMASSIGADNQDYTSALTSYSGQVKDIQTSRNAYLKRISDGTYLNKIVKFSNGTYAFVTNQGYVKKLEADIDTYTNIPKRDIIGISLSWDPNWIPGQIISTDPQLVVGTPMTTTSQSIGNEGNNVQFNSFDVPTNISYSGCYTDSPSTTYIGSRPSMNYVSNGDFSQNNINWSTNTVTLSASQNLTNWDSNATYYKDIATAGYAGRGPTGKIKLVELVGSQYISQTIDSLPPLSSYGNSTYELSFYYCGRINGSNNNSFEVQFNGIKQAAIQPSSRNWTLYRKNITITTTGPKVLLFKGTGISGKVAIQDVTLYAVGDYTYDHCRNTALYQGKQYFGLQQYNTETETGFCSVSNTVPSTNTAITEQEKPLWQSENQTNKIGIVAQLTPDGILTLYDSTYNDVYTSDLPTIPTNYMGCFQKGTSGIIRYEGMQNMREGFTSRFREGLTAANKHMGKKPASKPTVATSTNNVGAAVGGSATSAVEDRVKAEVQARVQAEINARIQAEINAQIQAERAAAERVERERAAAAAAAERVERERAAAAAAAERAAAERAERERVERERVERERLEKERVERERLEKERVERERLEKERVERERLAGLERERLEQERRNEAVSETRRREQQLLEIRRLALENQRIENERIENERIENERIENERLEKERLENERLEKERLEKERVEQERLAAEEQQRLDEQEEADARAAAKRAESIRAQVAADQLAAQKLADEQANQKQDKYDILFPLDPRNKKEVCDAFAKENGYGFFYLDNSNQCYAVDSFNSAANLTATSCTIDDNVPSGGPDSWAFYMQSENTTYNDSNRHFYLEVDDNIVTIFRGRPEATQGPSTILYTVPDDMTLFPNPEWRSENGKGGTNILFPNVQLAENEWIGSPNGTLRLQVKNGHLMVVTNRQKCSRYTNSSNKSYSYGNIGANAVYNLGEGVANNGSKFNTLSYIDADSKLYTYQSGLSVLDKAYTDLPNVNIPRKDGTTQSSISSRDQCKAKCDPDDRCVGYSYNSSLQTCNILQETDVQSGMMISDTKYYSSLKNKKPKTTRTNVGISNTVVGVGSNQYANYSVGTSYKPDRVGWEQTDDNSLMNKEADQVIGKKYDAKSSQVQGQYKKNNVDYRDTTAEQKRSDLIEQGIRIGNYDKIVSDSDVVALQQNSSYLLWSILAVGTVLVSINIVRK
jgi:hypothetical protein